MRNIIFLHFHVPHCSLIFLYKYTKWSGPNFLHRTFHAFSLKTDCHWALFLSRKDWTRLVWVQVFSFPAGQSSITHMPSVNPNNSPKTRRKRRNDSDKNTTHEEKVANVNSVPDPNLVKNFFDMNATRRLISEFTEPNTGTSCVTWVFVSLRLMSLDPCQYFCHQCLGLVSCLSIVRRKFCMRLAESSNKAMLLPNKTVCSLGFRIKFFYPQV